MFQSDILNSNLIQNSADKLDELRDQFESILSSINDKHAHIKTSNVTFFLPMITLRKQKTMKEYEST